MRIETLQHEFVEFIPSELEEGVLYISIPYATAVHKCCCGCGEKVVTPLTPTDWSITFDGETVSLSPSVGNWSYQCQSHYWIRNDRVMWAAKWSQERIAAGRQVDRETKSERYSTSTESLREGTNSNERTSVLRRLFKWLKGKKSK